MNLCSRPSARAVYSRVPLPVQETPTLKFCFSLLQQAWNRDSKGFYGLISQVETGTVQFDEPIHSLIIDYKRVSCKDRVDSRGLANADIRVISESVFEYPA